MSFVYSLLIIVLSSLLWRIRGGLWKEYIPMNKIWYALAFAVYSCFYFSNTVSVFLIAFIACYTSYQLYGWGLYIGRLLLGCELDPNKDKECELIDNLLYSIKFTFKGKTVWLYEYPRLFGFCGTTLTGLIITFILGLFTRNIVILLSGLSMGICYWLGGIVNKFFPEKKLGWGYGEYIWGAVEGAVLAYVLLW